MSGFERLPRPQQHNERVVVAVVVVVVKKNQHHQNHWEKNHRRCCIPVVDPFAWWEVEDHEVTTEAHAFFPTPTWNMGEVEYPAAFPHGPMVKHRSAVPIGLVERCVRVFFFCLVCIGCLQTEKGGRTTRHPIFDPLLFLPCTSFINHASYHWHSLYQFRWLLLVAMMSRAVMIPIQIYMNPIWAQLVADTLPAMAFASVWTLLVSFFVKLVGVALGTGGSGDGSDATPIGVVIQCTAYVVYVMLMAMYFVNDVAAVLLYALLCCIYAALWGTSLYFCPRLLTLVYPTFLSMMNSTTETTRNIPNRGNGTNLRSTATSNSAGGENNSSHSSSSNNNTNSKLSALAIRLAVSGVLCVVVFGARTVGFCRKIVAPDHTASWWWQYGCLELFPSILFMLLIKPKCSGGGKNNAAKTSSQSPQSRQEPSDWHGAGGGRRTFSVSHVGRDGVKGADESIPLMKSMGGYGSGGSAGSGPPSPSSLR